MVGGDQHVRQAYRKDEIERRFNFCVNQSERWCLTPLFLHFYRKNPNGGIVFALLI